ncbi:serine hydrolase domain-containing protein [uncultured Draconibacterium sp.]|uniref:serine hydrolase domain-containing protein n=1 Tax=uncultured Draconibacterium sp. TaxID=1573823 RepID=UPI002AA7C5A9|nr:serine hydrolase domain-containing protein [uncultured Draconibacterium sp.]
MKKLLFALCFSAFTLIAFSQKKEKDYTDAFKLVEVWLEAQKDFENLPGLSAIILKDQEVLWKAGFGYANPEIGVETKPSTLYSICSISKLFTSVAVMKLYDEGKLRLDDEIHTLLPWFDLEQQFPASGPITIRSLLTHSSGLPRESAHPYWTGPDFPFPTSDAVKTDLKTQETLYPASTYWQYSNLAMSLLGEVVKEVSGMAYNDYIQENILTPLGLNNTRPFLPEDKYGTELSLGFSSEKRDRQREKVNFFQAKGIKAAAGFSSNVEDLAKFAAWQLRLIDTTTTEILKPSTLQNMQRVHFLDPDWESSWGLGFSVRKDAKGNTVVGHGGSCPGYRTQLSIYPKEKLAFSVMINASGTTPAKYISGIKNIMSEVKDKPEERTVDLDEYSGLYTEQPWWSEVYYGELNGQLVSMSLPTNSPTLTFYKHIEGDTFKRIRKDKELGETVVFERDENSKVYRIKQHGNYSVRMKN